MRRQVSGHKQAQLARLLGLLFIVAGFVVIGLGWNGMAKRTCLDCQMPYLLSGGATGLGLIVFGCAMLVVAQIRAERIRMGAYVDQITAGLKGAAGPSLASATQAEGHANGDGRVVAGPSTYHRPDCTLVKGKDDLELLPVEAAVARGLSPCRVCEPAAPPAEEQQTEVLAPVADEEPSST